MDTHLLHISDKLLFITPDMISLSHVAIAALGARLVISESLTQRRIGVVLFELRSMLDSYDGMVARARRNEKGMTQVSVTKRESEKSCDQNWFDSGRRQLGLLDGWSVRRRWSGLLLHRGLDPASTTTTRSELGHVILILESVRVHREPLPRGGDGPIPDPDPSVQPEVQAVSSFHLYHLGFDFATVFRIPLLEPIHDGLP